MIRRLRLLLAALALALALPACGGDEGGTPSDSDGQGGNGQSISPPTSEIQKDTYEIAKSSCGLLPVEHTAREYGLPPSATEDDVAQEYSKLYQPGPDQDAALDGCIAGLAEAPRR